MNTHEFHEHTQHSWTPHKVIYFTGLAFSGVETCNFLDCTELLIRAGKLAISAHTFALQIAPIHKALDMNRITGAAELCGSGDICG